MLHRWSKPPILDTPYTERSHREVIGGLGKEKEKGYTKAVDLWSLGIVTLCLLTGDSLVSPDELSQLSNASIAQKVTQASTNLSLIRQWKDIGSYARGFIEQLLVFDAAERMTAHQAIQHDWFCKPRGVGDELKKLYERANRQWHPRPGNMLVVENIPDVQQRPKITTEFSINGHDKVCANTPRKLPDVTSSPYFSLDRHLQVAIPPTKRIQPPVPHGYFNQPRGQKSKRFFSHAMAKRVQIRSVQAGDIFSQASPNPRQDWKEAADLRIMIRSKSQTAPKTDTIADLARSPLKTPRSDQTEGLGMAPSKKRARDESFTPDERRLHDEVGRAHPMLMSAKRFGEEISKKRQQQKRT